MKYVDWDPEKNERLARERGISFEAMLVAIEDGNILDIVEHPNARKYPNQKMLIVRFQEYAYLVPFVEDEERIFLKTIIPSREATKKYINIINNNKETP
ncbi:MAG: BrnT family toxin [Parcubacteria group bacterium]|nr:BrnT family toxin [Parcubacteria group bacterium]